MTYIAILLIYIGVLLTILVAAVGLLFSILLGGIAGLASRSSDEEEQR